MKLLGGMVRNSVGSILDTARTVLLVGRVLIGLAFR
jgi:hypothetical protein